MLLNYLGDLQRHVPDPRIPVRGAPIKSHPRRSPTTGQPRNPCFYAYQILAGPAAATYLFRDEIEAVNRDLQQLHFRRAPLALTADEAELTPSNPQRLALRRLEPLQRLRSSTTARLIHNEGWQNALRGALA